MIADNCILLDVQDSGKGISDKYIDHVFEPYTQEDSGYSRAYEGVGLGLSLVKKYLDMNETGISVKSKSGEGTTFTIHFRKDKTEITKVKIKPDIKKPALGAALRPEKLFLRKVQKVKGKPAILIVEDKAINQFYIKTVLKNDFLPIGVSSAEKVSNNKVPANRPYTNGYFSEKRNERIGTYKTTERIKRVFKNSGNCGYRAVFQMKTVKDASMQDVMNF